MTILLEEGDGIIGKRTVYIARKVSGPRLMMEEGRHRGLGSVLYDTEAYIDIAIEGDVELRKPMILDKPKPSRSNNFNFMNAP